MRLALPVFSAILLLAGCGASRDIQNTDAVRQAIVEHLSKRGDLNMSSMDVDVDSVSFRQNEADATVSIHLKGGSAAQGMRMSYLLEKKGGAWEVKERKGGSANPANPHGAPPAAGGADLPPGHPPLGSGGGTPQ